MSAIRRYGLRALAVACLFTTIPGRGRVHLFVSFNCLEGLEEHHKAVVNWMLSTLEAIDA